MQLLMRLDADIMRAMHGTEITPAEAMRCQAERDCGGGVQLAVAPGNSWETEVCRHMIDTGKPAEGCAQCKGNAAECRHPGRLPMRAHTKRCKPGVCRQFEPLRISIVLPARDEGDEVAATIASVRAGGVDQVLVVDDASRDGSCLGLDLSGGTVLVRNTMARTPSYCRNTGAGLSTGDILIFADAHIRVEPDALRALAVLAHRRQAIVCASVTPLGGERDWVYYGGRLRPVKGNPDAGYEVSYNQEQPAERGAPIGALIGACYAMPMTVYDRIGGWPRTISWGYNEQALSMAAWFCGVPMLSDKAVVSAHRFKKRFNYPVRASNSHINRFLVHRILFSAHTWAWHWLPRFQKAFPPATVERAEEWLSQPWVQEEHDRFQARKVRTDDEFFAHAVSTGGAAADRRKDGQ